MGSKTVTGRSSSWNLRSCLLECEMYLPKDYYCVWYSSYHLSWYASAFDGLSNVIPQVTLRHWQIQPAQRDNAFITWLLSIQQAWYPSHATEWHVNKITQIQDCSSFCGTSLKPSGEASDSLRWSPVVRQGLSVFSPSGTVPVPCRSYNRVFGELSGEVSWLQRCFQSIQHHYI